MIRLGVATHAAGMGGRSLCGIPRPKYLANTPKAVDCVRCLRIRAKKRIR